MAKEAVESSKVGQASLCLHRMEILGPKHTRQRGSLSRSLFSCDRFHYYKPRRQTKGTTVPVFVSMHCFCFSSLSDNLDLFVCFKLLVLFIFKLSGTSHIISLALGYLTR